MTLTKGHLAALFLSFTFALLGGPVAKADYLFAPAFSYRSSETNDGASTTEIVTGIRGAKQFKKGWLLGLQYFRSSTEAGGNDNSMNLVGPSVGFERDGFNILVTYHLYGTLSQGNSKYTSASGPQVDVGWFAKLNNSISLGPQITYISATFKKFETSGGTETTVDYSVTDILPVIALWFRF